MTSFGETEIEPGLIGEEGPAIRRPRESARRRKAIELLWPSTPLGRERAFDQWQGAAMQCLREGGSDFAVIISFRKTLRPDGMITATNAELSQAAGCSAKTLEFDLEKLKRAGLITLTVRSMKGFRGRIRIIRLSLPAPDGTGSRI